MKKQNINMMKNENKHISRRKAWRIVMGNINTFPCDERAGNEVKLNMLNKLIGNESTDIVLISEHNKNMRYLPKKLQPWTIMKSWWDRKAIRSTYLKLTVATTNEPGGTMIITTARATAHTIKAGEDEYNLGRWNYVTLRGRNQHMTTVISAY